MVLETKACGACARTKRKCGKQTPHCLRCRTRRIECVYPPTKPTHFVLYKDDKLGAEDSVLPYHTPDSSSSSPVLQTRPDHDITLSLGLDIPRLSGGLDNSHLASNWFTSPETWEVYRFPQLEDSTFSDVGLKRHIRRIHRWLSQWVTKGSNPFIHFRLYRTRFPKCVQDAYTTLSCYLQKTAANERTVFRIIEDRTKQLLVENKVLPAGSLDSLRTNSASLDSLEHVARVQALMVYQFLGLYDGDIRLRHLAESNIPILNSWKEQMIEHATRAVCLGESIMSSNDEQMSLSMSLTDIAHYENLLWYSWILAESMRRTWVMANGIQAIYLMTQQNLPCQGCLMFTTRKGVWEAQSAIVWEKLCSEVNVGLMQIKDSDKLFAEVAPENVNDFTKALLEATYGIERMERWGVQIED